MTTWKAGGDRVILEEIKAPTQTASGIVIPDKTNASIRRGIVLASGPEAKGIQPGDTVYISTKYGALVEPGIYSVQVEDVLAAQRDE